MKSCLSRRRRRGAASSFSRNDLLLALMVHQAVAFLSSSSLLALGFAFSPSQKRSFVAPPLAASRSMSSSPSTRQSGSSLQAATALSLEPDSAPVPVPSSASADTDSPKVGVLMLNLGGPEKSEDVEGFLYNLFADPDIIRLPGPLSPLQSLIAYFISKRRAPKSRAAYESIGGGSPILKYSNAQARLLRESLQERYGLAIQTYIGMRYWHPFTEEALKQIRDDKIEALIILPLYPQFSISTSGSSLRVLQEEFSKNAARYGGMVHTVVASWYDRPGYVQAMADLIQNELEAFTAEQAAEAKAAAPDLKPFHVLFSAHGVPQSYIQAGDPYQKQIIDCVDKIAAALPNPDQVAVHLSYQSRVGPIEWLRPYTDDVLPELGESGVRNLVVVPISFVSEHIETLEEIDIEYRELAEESGVTNWRRCPALNTDAAFIRDMGDLVYEALAEPTQSVTEACVANSVSEVRLEDDIRMAGVQGVGAEGSDDLGMMGSFVGGGGGASVRQQQGVPADPQLQKKERINARVAILGVALTIFLEVFNGKSLVQMLFGDGGM